MAAAADADKKKKKEAKAKVWPTLKKMLKEQGKLRRKDYVDHCVFEMNVPAFPEEIIESGTLKCGFFNWKFKLLNKQIHGKKLVPDENEEGGAGEENMDEGNPQPGPANQQHRVPDVHRFPAGSLAARIARIQRAQQRAERANPANANNSQNHVNIAKKLRRKRQRQLAKRAGFVLQAECAEDVNQHKRLVKEFKYWRVNALIKTAWKGTARDERLETAHKNNKKFKHRCIVFSNKDPDQIVRWFGPMAIKKSGTLVVRLYVKGMPKANVLPPIHFKNAPGRVCIRAKDEHIFMHRETLAINSPVFREHIQNGMGTDERNAIPIGEDKFTPSLVRLAFRAILTPTKIDCHSVRELLDFGCTYKIHNLLGQIEESLINRRKCKHFWLAKKMDLAYEFGLDELINTSVQRMNTTEAIEYTLDKKKNLNEEFKAMLNRKLAAMKKEEAELRAKRRAARKQRQKAVGTKKKRHRTLAKEAKQLHEVEEEKKRRGEGGEATENGVRKGIKKMRIHP